MRAEPDRVHGTAIAVAEEAVLFVGPSGSGKSDLAWRCLLFPPSILLTEPARLVADDQVMLQRRDAGLIVSAPSTIARKLEIRGVGIVDLASLFCPEARLALVVQMANAQDIDRLPETGRPFTVAGVPVPMFRLAPFEASAPSKVLLLLGLQTGRIVSRA